MTVLVLLLEQHREMPFGQDPLHVSSLSDAAQIIFSDTEFNLAAMPAAQSLHLTGSVAR